MVFLFFQDREAKIDFSCPERRFVNRPETEAEFSYDIVVCCAGPDAAFAARVAETLEERHAFKVAFYRDANSEVFFFGTVHGNSIEAVDCSSMVVVVISEDTNYREDVVGEEFDHAVEKAKPIALVCRGQPQRPWENQIKGEGLVYEPLPSGGVSDEDVALLCDKIVSVFSGPRYKLKRVSKGGLERPSSSRVIDIYSNDFLGREEDTDSVNALLRKKKVVSLIAGPCVGKTRLAHEIANAHPLPAYIVDFTAAESPEQVATEVAAAFGFQLAGARGKGAESGDQLQARVGRSLAELGPLLMLMDNFEQAVQSAEATIPCWSRYAPDAKFLVTSRLSLRLNRTLNADYLLEPLRTPSRSLIDSKDRAGISQTPGMQLLLRRLESDSVSDNDFFVLAELCLRCAGFPEPIETLAMLLSEGVFTAQHLLKNEKRFTKAAYQGFVKEEGHNHLFPKLEHLCETLSRAELVCWWQSAMFADGVTPDSSESVFLQDENKAREIYYKLHSWRILRLDKTSQRSRMYRPYQEFASLKQEAWLKDDEESIHRDRYLRYFFNEVMDKQGSLSSTDVRETLDWFQEERDNIKRAVEYGVRDGRAEEVAKLVVLLDMSFFVDGPASGYKNLLKIALKTRGQLDTSVVAELLIRLSRTEWSLGDYEACRLIIDEALELSKSLPDEKKKIHLEARAWSGSFREDADISALASYEAEMEYRDLLDQFEAISDYRGVDFVARGLISLLDRQARVSEADEVIRKYDTAGVRNRDSFTYSRLLNNIGIFRWHNGQPAEALDYLNRAKKINLNNRDNLLLAGNYTNLAVVNLDLEEFDRADHFLNKAQELHRKCGNLGWLSVNHVIRCRYWLFREQYELTLDECESVREAVKNVGYLENQTLFDAIEAEATYFLNGGSEASLLLARSVKTRLEKTASKMRRYYAALGLVALCEAECGNKTEALLSIESARAISELRGIDAENQSGYYRRWYKRIITLKESLLNS